MMKKESAGIAVILLAIFLAFAFLSLPLSSTPQSLTGRAATEMLGLNSLSSPDILLADGAKAGTTMSSDPFVTLDSVAFEDGYLVVHARQTTDKKLLAVLDAGKIRRKIMSANETVRFVIPQAELISNPTLTIANAQYVFHDLEYPQIIDTSSAEQFGDETQISSGSTLSTTISEKGISTTCGTCADCQTCMGGTNTTLCTLTGDITSAATCITLGNSSRTLDCLGSTISFGSGGSGGVFGITGTGVSNITITNCRVIDTSPLGAGSSPIRLLSSSNYTISNNILQSNGTTTNHGLLIDGSSIGNINDNTINSNGSSVDNDGIRINNAVSNVSIFDNAIRTHSLSSGQGVRLIGGACGTSSLFNAIENNTIIVAGRGVSGIGVSITFPTGSCPSPGRIWNYTRIVGNNIQMLNNLCCGIGIDLLGLSFGTNVQQIRNTYIMDNTVYVNGSREMGIKLCSSCNGTQHVSGNTIITNSTGFTSSGFWAHNVSTTNTINGSPVYFYGGSGDSPACPGSIAGDAYHATLINCSGVSSSGLFVNDPIAAQNADSISITNSNLIRGVSADGATNFVFNDNIVGSSRNDIGFSASFLNGTNAFAEDNTFLNTGGFYCEQCDNGEFRYNEFFTNNTSGDAFSVQYSGDTDYPTNVRIHNNTFNVGEDGVAMDIYGHQNIQVADNNISHSGPSGNTEAISIGESHNLLFRNNIVSVATTAPLTEIFDLNNSRIYNNSFSSRGTAFDGDTVITTFLGRSVNFTENVIESIDQDDTSDRYMFECFECGDWLVKNNTLRGSGAGIFGFAIYQSNITVTNNSIFSNGTDLAGVDLERFDVTTFQTNITHNVFVLGSENSTFVDGIYMFGGVGEQLQNNNISNNTFTVIGNNSNGIYLDFHVNTNTIENNTFNVIGTTSYGVRADNPAQNNTFAGNIFNASNWFITETGTVLNFTKTTFNFNNLSVTFNAFNINSSADVNQQKLNTSFGIGGRDQFFLNSTNLSFLNTSATLRFRNVLEADPTPLADYGDDGNFVDCLFSTCVEDSYVGGLFKFNVTSFTAYAYTENTGGANGTLNVSASKTDTADPTNQSTTLNYTLEINVTGGTAYNVTVNETYPPETTFVTATPAPDNGTNNTFSLGDLTNTTTTINISLLVLSGIPNGTLINNTIVVTFQNSSGDTLNLSLTENTTVLGCVISGSNVSGSNTTNCTISTSSITNSTIDISSITDSNVTNSTLNNTNVYNSTVNGSTVNDSIVNGSTIVNTTATNTTATNTTMTNTTATNTTATNTTMTNTTATNTTATNTTMTNTTATNTTAINTTMTNTTVTNTTATNTTMTNTTATNTTATNTTMTNTTVTNTTATNTTMTNTTATNTTFVNTTVTNTTVNGSTIINTTITDANVTNTTITNGTIFDSNVTNTTVTNGTITDSNVTNTTITNGTITNGTIIDSNITDSNITNGSVTNATITDTNITNGTVTNGTVTDSNVTNSTITNGSVVNTTVVGANITDSNVTDSNVTNSTVFNSTIINATITNLTITNGTITGDTCTSGIIVFNGQTFTCPANLSTIYAGTPPIPPAPGGAGGGGGGGSGSMGNTPIQRQNQTPSAVPAPAPAFLSQYAPAPTETRQDSAPTAVQTGGNAIAVSAPVEESSTVESAQEETISLSDKAAHFFSDNRSTLATIGLSLAIVLAVTLLLLFIAHRPKTSRKAAPIDFSLSRLSKSAVRDNNKKLDTDLARLNRELADIEKLLKKK